MYLHTPALTTINSQYIAYTLATMKLIVRLVRLIAHIYQDTHQRMYVTDWTCCVFTHASLSIHPVGIAECWSTRACVRIQSYTHAKMMYVRCIHKYLRFGLVTIPSQALLSVGDGNTMGCNLLPLMQAMAWRWFTHLVRDSHLCDMCVVMFFIFCLQGFSSCANVIAAQARDLDDPHGYAPPELFQHICIIQLILLALPQFFRHCRVWLRSLATVSQPFLSMCGFNQDSKTKVQCKLVLFLCSSVLCVYVHTLTCTYACMYVRT